MGDFINIQCFSIQGQGERLLVPNQGEAWFMFVFLLPFSTKFVKVKYKILIKHPMRIVSTTY